MSNSQKISLNLLDCTLRDGGYYNNWDFSEKLIQNYLVNLSRTRIKYVEIGFRNFKQNRQLGATGYTEDKLLNKLQIPSNLKIGVMVNASELKKYNYLPLQNLRRLFPIISKNYLLSDLPVILMKFFYCRIAYIGFKKKKN